MIHVNVFDDATPFFDFVIDFAVFFAVLVLMNIPAKQKYDFALVVFQDWAVVAAGSIRKTRSNLYGS